MISKQVIVVRKDLNMRKGKMISQGSHASMKALLDIMNRQFLPTSPSCSFYDVEVLSLSLPDGSALQNWINGNFTKITVSVDSEAELDEIYNKAIEAKLICSLIVDAGLTEFKGIPTKTCVAIGPNWDEEIDKITGKLKLL